MDNWLTYIVNIFLLSGLTVGDIRMDNLKYKGCFDLSYSLSMNYHEHLPLISLEGCIDVCSTKATRYIGIELSDNFCYCGDDIVESSNSRSDSMCNVLCSDVSTRTCGGDWLMSVYDTTDPATTLAKDNNGSVSFLIGLSTGIRVYNETNFPNFETVMLTGSNGWAYTVDYHFARRLVYANTKGKLIMVNVSQSFGVQTATPSVLRVLSPCDGFAVDWVSDKVYWADCTNRRAPIISKVDLDGSNNEVVSTLSGNPRSVKRMEVDPYKRMLFWQADGVIESFNFTNRSFHANLSKESIVVRALSLDRSVQRIYYVGSEDQASALFSMDYRGKGHIKIFQVAQLQSVFGLGLQGGFVYWINYAMSTDIIYKAPLRIGGGRNTTMLQTVEKAVWHMRVVHSDIQATPVENVCSRKGCSHFCEAQTSTSATCHCPEGSVLSIDGVSCETKNETLTTPMAASPSFAPAVTLSTTTTAEPEGPHNVKHIGCFGTAYASAKQYNHRMSNITLQGCVEKCAGLKTAYAGIGASDKTCYCGPDLPFNTPKLLSIICMDQCPDMPRLPCGGDYLMTVYDISKMLPSINESDVEVLKKDVSFLIGHSGSVKLYNLSDLNNPQLLFEIDSAYSVDYHYSKNLMFTSTRKALFKSTLYPKHPPSTPLTQVIRMSGCEAFAVDWVRDRIYWIDCPAYIFSLKVIDLNGQNSTTLFSKVEDVLIKRMVIDPYVGILFWINDGVIGSCEINGANMRTNISNAVSSVRGMTLDISTQRLFYLTVGDSSALYSTDYDGNNLKIVLRSTDMRAVYGLGIIGGYVYWINYVNFDILYKAPLYQNSSPRVQSLKVFRSDNTVWHMKVVDPDFQKDPHSSPCSSGRTSCMVQAVAYKQNTVAGLLLLGVVAVVGVLLVVGLLMYLTDMKYYHMLRSKLTSVPYTREREDGPTTYNLNDDSVNLI